MDKYSNGRRVLIDMQTNPLVMALVAGFAVLLVVGAAVTELALPWIEFSLFVGFPAGLVAGVAVAAAVYLGLAADAPARRRRVAVATAGFGAVFLAVLTVATVTASLSVVASLVLGVVAGLTAATLAYVLGGATRPSRTA